MATFFNALTSGLSKDGFEVDTWIPGIPSGNYFFHTAARIGLNTLINFFVNSGRHDVYFMLDYDGFALKKTHKPHVVSPRGIFAEIAPTERGLYRLFLKIQARLEKLNLEI